MKTLTKHTVNCPREGDIIHIAGIEWTVTTTFPVIRCRDDADGYTVMAHRPTDNGTNEYTEFTLWDHEHDGVEVYR